MESVIDKAIQWFKNISEATNVLRDTYIAAAHTGKMYMLEGFEFYG